MNFKMIAALAVIIAASAAAWNFLFAPTKAFGETKLVVIPEYSELAKEGQVAFEKFCASCHGLNAVGTDKGPSFLHAVYKANHHGDISFQNAPLVGARAHHWPFGDMPPTEGITEDEILLVIKYVRELQAANGF